MKFEGDPGLVKGREAIPNFDGLAEFCGAI
jgi:hypothetical protein